MGKLCSYLFFLFLNHPDYFSRIWSKLTIGGPLPNTGSNIYLGLSATITSRMPRRKSPVSSELTCNFQLTQYIVHTSLSEIMWTAGEWTQAGDEDEVEVRALSKRQPVYKHRSGLFLEVIKQQWPVASLPRNKMRKGEIIPNCKSRLVNILAAYFWESYFLSPSPSPLSRAYCSEFKTQWPSF